MGAEEVKSKLTGRHGRLVLAAAAPRLQARAPADQTPSRLGIRNSPGAGEKGNSKQPKKTDWG